MAIYWRDRAPLMARYHTMGKLPKFLKTDVSLRPEDEAIIYGSSEIGTPIVGGNLVTLGDRKFRKNNHAVFIYSGNTFPIPLAFNHRITGTNEQYSGVFHLDVKINRYNPKLIQERLLSNFPGTNEIDVLTVSELIERNLGTDLDKVFTDIPLEELRDQDTQNKLVGKARSIFDSILDKHGFELREIRVVIGETSMEKQQAMKAAHEARLEEIRLQSRLEQQEKMSEAETEAMEMAQKNLKKQSKKLAKIEAQYMRNQMISRIKQEEEDGIRNQQRIKAEHEQELSNMRNKTMRDDEKERELNRLELEFRQKQFAREQEHLASLERMQREQWTTNEVLSQQERELEIEVGKQELVSIDFENKIKELELRLSESENAVKEAESRSKIEAIGLKDKRAKMELMNEQMEKIRANRERINAEKIDQEKTRIELEENRIENQHRRNLEMNEQILTDREKSREFLKEKIEDIKSGDVASVIAAMKQGNLTGSESLVETPQSEPIDGKLVDSNEQTQPCPKCGAMLDIGWKICPYC